MTGLLVVAASGLARELLAAERTMRRYDEVLLLDDDPARHGTEVGGARVVGGIDAVVDHPAYDVVVAAGRGAARRSIVARLSGLGVGPERYATTIHPSAVVADGCSVGSGSIVLAGVVLTADVRVGAHVVVMPHVTLTHDDVLEDYATLAAGVCLAGSVRVGEAAYLGTHASVREGCTVGPDAVLGMAAALLGDLPGGQTWAGVPARPLRG